MDLATARFLLSPAGQVALAEAERLPPGPAHHLANLDRLRRTLAPEQAGAVLDQAAWRRQGADKFSRAGAMLFTATGVQQATGEIVARHRAARFAGRQVADLTCGIGGDALALAAVARRTLAADRDPARLLLARHNLGVYEVAAQMVGMDLLHPAVAFGADWAIFVDPGRRGTSGARIFDPAAYEPPLVAIQARYGGMDLALKVAPGIDYAALPWVDELEIVSLAGDVKEAVLWGRGLATPGVRRRATLLPAGATLTDADAADACPVRPPGGYLYEPDGAVVRAGLVRPLAARLDLWQIDPQIAYLSGNQPAASPFTRGFAVEEAHPFNLKLLNRRLAALGVGTVELKGRGVAWEPESLRPRLKLHGPRARTIIFTRLGADPWMFVCTPLPTAAAV
jgi:hypothetical protein